MNLIIKYDNDLFYTVEIKTFTVKQCHLSGIENMWAVVSHAVRNLGVPIHELKDKNVNILTEAWGFISEDMILSYTTSMRSREDIFGL